MSVLGNSKTLGCWSRSGITGFVSLCPDCVGPYEAKELWSVKLEKDGDSEETAEAGSGVAGADCS